MKPRIVGFGDDGDRVLEVIEYLRRRRERRRRGAAWPTQAFRTSD